MRTNSSFADGTRVVLSVCYKAMSSLIINAEAIPEAIPVESKSNEYNNKLASAYAPVATDSDTPVISFSNLSIEYVAASAIEAAGLQALSLGRGGQDNIKSKKVILKRVSGEITSGLWGILGLSGSGKVYPFGNIFFF